MCVCVCSYLYLICAHRLRAIEAVRQKAIQERKDLAAEIERLKAERAAAAAERARQKAEAEVLCFVGSLLSLDVLCSLSFYVLFFGLYLYGHALNTNALCAAGV